MVNFILTCLECLVKEHEVLLGEHNKESIDVGRISTISCLPAPPSWSIDNVPD